MWQKPDRLCPVLVTASHAVASRSGGIEITELPCTGYIGRPEADDFARSVITSYRGEIINKRGFCAFNPTAFIYSHELV